VGWVVALALGASALVCWGQEGTAALYTAHCAKCHGLNGVPRKIAKGAPNFNDPAWRETATIEVMVEVIESGKGKIMPGFGEKLASEQIRELTEYVLSLGQAAPQPQPSN
jgi:mono/diheme cytochrome c family protein